MEIAGLTVRRSRVATPRPSVFVGPASASRRPAPAPAPRWETMERWDLQTVAAPQPRILRASVCATCAWRSSPMTPPGRAPSRPSASASRRCSRAPRSITSDRPPSPVSPPSRSSTSWRSWTTSPRRSRRWWRAAATSTPLCSTLRSPTGGSCATRRPPFAPTTCTSWTSAEKLERRLRFRDRLRADPVLAGEYVALKRTLAERYSEDRESYTEAKSEFVKRHERAELPRAGPSSPRRAPAPPTAA